MKRIIHQFFIILLALLFVFAEVEAKEIFSSFPANSQQEFKSIKQSMDSIIGLL